MAGTKCNQFTTAKVAGSVGVWKGALSYTPPSGIAARMPRPVIEFDATASTAPTNRVRVVRAGTGQVGTARNPVAPAGNNPAGVSLGTGLENLSTIGTGGVTIWEQECKGFGAFEIKTPLDLLVAPGETIQIDFNAGGACNAQAGWAGIEL